MTHQLFIEWNSLDSPFTYGKVFAVIVKVEIARDEKRITDWLGYDFATDLGSKVEVIWLTHANTEGESRIVTVHLIRPSGVARVYQNIALSRKIKLLSEVSRSHPRNQSTNPESLIEFIISPQ